MRRACSNRWQRRIVLLSLLVGAALPGVLLAEPPGGAPEGGSIEAPGAVLEKLHERTAPIHGGLSEGPAAAPDGSIYFSDIPQGSDRGMILRFDPATGKTTVFTDNSHKSNGLAFDSAGRLVSCEGADGGARAIARWDIKTGKRTVLVDRYQEKRFNSPNDLCLDAADRIYFTDPRYVGDEPLELKHRAVYRLDTAGKLIEITHDVTMPNGIAISPDGRTLYVAETSPAVEAAAGKPARAAVMRIYAFGLDEHGLVTGKRRTFHDFGKRLGCDGMTIDTDGNLYLATRDPSWPSVLVLAPDGQELARISTYAEQDRKTVRAGRQPNLPSNVEFGVGNDANSLYMTIDTGLYRTRLTKRGFRWPTK